MIPDYILKYQHIPLTSLERSYIDELIEPWLYIENYDKSKEAFLSFYYNLDDNITLFNMLNSVPNENYLKGLLKISNIDSDKMTIYEMINLLQARILY